MWIQEHFYASSPIEFQDQLVSKKETAAAAAMDEVA